MFITHRRFPFVVSSLWTFPSFKYFMCQVGFFSSEADKQLQYLLFFFKWEKVLHSIFHFDVLAVLLNVSSL